MDELTSQPIQPAYTPGDTRQNDPGPDPKRPRPKRDVPVVDAPEELLDSAEDETGHSVDTFASSMEEALEAYEALLVSSVAAWKELDQAVRSASDAIVRMDLEEIERQTAHQETLTAAIRRLEADQAGFHSALESHDPGLNEEILELIRRVAEYRSIVRDSNRIQERLTAHSSQLVQRISNTLVRFFTTYPEPQAGGFRPGR